MLRDARDERNAGAEREESLCAEVDYLRAEVEALGAGVCKRHILCSSLFFFFCFLFFGSTMWCLPFS